MKHVFWVLFLIPTLLIAQQANVNLDYNPHKNRENLTPFSAPLNSPDVDDQGMVTFQLKAPNAKEVSLAPGAITTSLDKESKP
ncbi:MAG: esterase, partial [Bacteroidales bacterium]|nr:esterase [Bacteroidales bacterium]